MSAYELTKMTKCGFFFLFSFFLNAIGFLIGFTFDYMERAGLLHANGLASLFRICVAHLDASFSTVPHTWLKAIKMLYIYIYSLHDKSNFKVKIGYTSSSNQIGAVVA